MTQGQKQKKKKCLEETEQANDSKENDLTDVT